MSDSPAIKISASKPATLVEHHRQVLWQILVPLGVCLAIILGLCVGVVLAGIRGNPETARWMSISVIWLIIPLTFAGMLLLLILSGCVYLLLKLLRILPHYTQLAQAYAHYASVMVRFYADKIANPVLSLRAAWAGWQTLRKDLFK